MKKHIEYLCDLIWLDNVQYENSICNFITENKSLINSHNSKGQTPLYLAFRKANITISKYLINNCASLKCLNRDGSSPITGFL